MHRLLRMSLVTKSDTTLVLNRDCMQQPFSDRFSRTILVSLPEAAICPETFTSKEIPTDSVPTRNRTTVPEACDTSLCRVQISITRAPTTVDTRLTIMRDEGYSIAHILHSGRTAFRGMWHYRFIHQPVHCPFKVVGIIGKRFL